MQETDWTQADATALAVLVAHGGVGPMKAFAAAGLTAHQVAAIFRRQVIGRARKGWYVDPAVPWQGVCAVRVGGVLGCVSAAQSYGVPVPHGSWNMLHVVVAPNTPRLRHSRDSSWPVAPGDEAAVQIHWAETVDPRSGWRVSLVDALLGLACCVPDDWFVVAMDAVLHRPRDGAPLLSQVDYVRLAARLPRGLRRQLARVDPRAESLLETLLRLELIRRGIGPFVIQVWPHVAHRVDFLLRGKLIVEVDGRQFHDPSADSIRDALLRSLGYRIIHFTYEEVLFDIDGVIARIEAALATL